MSPCPIPFSRLRVSQIILRPTLPHPQGCFRHWGFCHILNGLLRQPLINFLTTSPFLSIHSWCLSQCDLSKSQILCLQSFPGFPLPQIKVQSPYFYTHRSLTLAYCSHLLSHNFRVCVPCSQPAFGPYDYASLFTLLGTPTLLLYGKDLLCFRHVAEFYSSSKIHFKCHLL